MRLIGWEFYRMCIRDDHRTLNLFVFSVSNSLQIMVSITEKEFWFEFIEKYRSLPCLWNVYNSEYSNKQSREEGLQVLVEKCKQINPQANKDFVRKRIANLRTSFGREFKKIAKSKGTGSAAADVYVPTLWYYNELLFLKDCEVTREGNSSMTNSADEDFNEHETASEDCFTPPQTPGECSKSPQIYSKRKKLSLEQQKTKFFEKASEFMGQREEKKDDEFDILGKRFADHFRNMEVYQRLIAEKIVSDVLISGRLNQLTLHSTFTLCPDSQAMEEQQPAYVIDENAIIPSVQHSTSSPCADEYTQYVYYKK